MKQRLTVRMSRELNNVLTEKAQSIGISKNSLILQLLWEEVNKNLSKEELRNE